MTTPPPVLLDATTAAVYAGVRPATLRVWAHRYGLTRHRHGQAALYDMHELAAVLARRAADQHVHELAPSRSGQEGGSVS